MNRILIVEDEKPISDLIDMNLTVRGYQCRCVYDGLAAASLLDENASFDLILLDVMLPGADGFELMEYIRPLKIPVIFLTARGAVNDRVKGLRAGADDYIVKPFEMVELVARVETVLRRYNKSDNRLRVLDVEIDVDSRRVTQNGREIPLTNKEFALLLFARNKNIALFRENIFEQVWESNYMGDTRTVDLHVQRLRRKLKWEEHITAVYKVGYRLEV